MTTLAWRVGPIGAGRVGAAFRWALTRAIGAVFVLWAVATLTFFAVRLIPGDPAEAVLGGAGSQATPELLASVTAQYGFDRPLWEQYLLQLQHLVVGDLGRSYALKQPVSQVIGEQLPGTLVLAIVSLAVAWVLAIALGLWATRGGRVSAAVATTLEVAAAAVPHYWLGTLLILVFSVGLGWLPATSIPGPVGLILPVATLALSLAGFLGQIMREAMLAALDAPFVTSARTRGESETGVRLRHVVRHAALPGINLTGWAFGALISGAVVVETVFSRPGLGRTLLHAVTVRDIPLVLGVVLVVALSYIVITVLADLAERIVDPRLAQA